ncbi:AMP-binding protein [Kordiimonas pumila]|uniref:AMP-binding protein n=1 Tax=Kordiimonas pumila TaxID=2161677 RepID=A0ABV7D6K4_9PROT|nr:AMP-binding protein [Kordiimonas pumila]
MQLSIKDATLREIDLPAVDLDIKKLSDGTIFLKNNVALPDFDPLLYGHLKKRAAISPDKIALAERDKVTGAWRTCTFAELMARIRSVAQWLLKFEVGSERPLMIISGNTIGHAVMRLGAVAAGVPVCPISSNYALMGGDFGRLKYVFELVKPALIYAEEGSLYNKALLSLDLSACTIISALTDNMSVKTVSYSELLETVPAQSLEDVIGSVNPDGHAVYMLTSGSTGRPKAVILTQRMIMTSIFQAHAILGAGMHWDDKILDWLPWSHVSGATNLVGALVFGGSFYIDDGKPAPGLFEKTLKNLKELSVPYFANVPFGYAMLVGALEDDPLLRKAFFKNLHLMLYGGAGLSQDLYERLQAMAVAETGHRIFITTGYGATETTSGCMAIFFDTRKVGVGLPLPGVEVKLVPTDGEFEIRMRGPHIMSGYLDDPEKSAQSFDSEGFYKLGDLVNFHDPNDFAKGMYFSGRLAEQFKLGTGSWVSGGQVRAGIIACLSPLVTDLILCGEGRDALGALLVLNAPGLKSIFGLTLADDLSAHPEVLGYVKEKLTAYNAVNPGKSSRIARAAFLATPLSADQHELSDKGTINQAIASKNRVEEIEALYADDPSEKVIVF